MDIRFADAFYWIAMANPTDQWHEAAKQYDQSNQDVPIVTIEEVLTEFLNFYAGAGNHRRRIVGKMCDQVLLHPNISVVTQSHQSFSSGFELYRQREDKGYSLTDCISMIFCREQGVQEILTNDHHFEQEGFTILF